MRTLWSPQKEKIRCIAAAAGAALILASIVGCGITWEDHDSFERVDEPALHLPAYDPFRLDTLAASLNEPSALSLGENPPRLDGATALYPVYSAFVRAVYPKDFQSSYGLSRGPYKPAINCSGSSEAYQRLTTGQADIIFVGYPSKEERQMLDHAGMILNFIPLGREAFVFFVNPRNPVDELSISDIQKIYSGRSTNWREFGGENSSIRAFQRPDYLGSQKVFKFLMGEVPLMAPRQEEAPDGMGGVIQTDTAYRNYPDAIGYCRLFYAAKMVKDNKIKLLKIDGIAPSSENVANETYPYAFDFYAVTAETTNPQTEAFIKWMLSEQGQYLIEKTGYTPITAGLRRTEE